MAQSMRFSTRLLARMSSRTLQVPRRSFGVSSVARMPDLIQDLYLRELKAYKPPPQKASDAEGHVQKFTPPPTPQSPEETNLASEMKDYENQAVEVEGQAAPGESAEHSEEDFFEDIEKIDEDDGAHH
ncbi:ATP synthase F0 subcomplex subunit H atp14 [Elasticomyces elasticus]|uniref:ATP synthase F0 subcomplex subunit H atp14 n=1 Tax=Exophiala sideris TaxID=1016849 RepID=A0ABR0IVG2_9EURO|nr:ATP synthase F0 subcomplex subunit H atp14 [Elasticomyces elasticus]KAK5021461.1 ATP synthase F0 subcomplex subunit H atp14 [Exophiala sideris]KAK5024515.1 ATP synthase F0 subcomplex subunit H atp14 [Exophiala sideris]KAK5049593.1 ATP synthase F0 subcomplex subunit H atp14 [Exophiala sideris]KAK5176612.1 ATP synthase F0 subcomplex subunit H atp14 [Eurotiomycetes sp. CCFEE 6388]